MTSLMYSVFRPSIILLLLCISWSTLKAQEEEVFRHDCNYVSRFDSDTEEWSEWERGSNTFVFNFNVNNDIKVIYASGKIEILRNMGNKDEDRLGDEPYQKLNIMNKQGRSGEILMFDNGVILLFFGENYMVRFSP